jgi:AmmeMemoRadiSam system protein B
MPEKIPRMRIDLEFIPVHYNGRKMVLIRDPLGIIQEGKVVDPSIYIFLVLLDGTRTIRDLQMELMQQRGGVLVTSDEVIDLLVGLDASFLLDSEKYRLVRDKIIDDFSSKQIRDCFLCGRSYPKEPSQLNQMLDEILSASSLPLPPKGNIKAIIAPHIDLSAGSRVYASAYRMLQDILPTRVVILGIGHHMDNDLFCLTEKDFATPLGVVKTDSDTVQHLRKTYSNIIADNDFEHRSEHSIEFQVIFLQHLFGTESFTILPILCGPLMTNLPYYNRNAYLEKVGHFLKELKQIIFESEKENIIVAGVDFSHIGLKFGHETPADYIAGQAETHDRNLLKALSDVDADLLWEESLKVEDKYNVCGFSALTCLLEILPLCKGEVLDYQMWHEAATKSAVSFSAVLFTI